MRQAKHSRRHVKISTILWSWHAMACSWTWTEFPCRELHCLIFPTHTVGRTCGARIYRKRDFDEARQVQGHSSALRSFVRLIRKFQRKASIPSTYLSPFKVCYDIFSHGKEKNYMSVCPFRYRWPSNRSNWIRKLPSYGSSENGFESFRKTFRYFVHMTMTNPFLILIFLFINSTMQWNHPYDKKDFPHANRWGTLDAGTFYCKSIKKTLKCFESLICFFITD